MTAIPSFGSSLSVTKGPFVVIRAASPHRPSMRFTCHSNQFTFHRPDGRYRMIRMGRESRVEFIQPLFHIWKHPYTDLGLRKVISIFNDIEKFWLFSTRGQQWVWFFSRRIFLECPSRPRFTNKFVINFVCFSSINIWNLINICSWRSKMFSGWLVIASDNGMLVSLSATIKPRIFIHHKDVYGAHTSSRSAFLTPHRRTISSQFIYVIIDIVNASSSPWWSSSS